MAFILVLLDPVGIYSSFFSSITLNLSSRGKFSFLELLFLFLGLIYCLLFSRVDVLDSVMSITMELVLDKSTGVAGNSFTIFSLCSGEITVFWLLILTYCKSGCMYLLSIILSGD